MLYAINVKKIIIVFSLEVCQRSNNVEVQSLIQQSQKFLFSFCRYVHITLFTLRDKIHKKEDLILEDQNEK